MTYPVTALPESALVDIQRTLDGIAEKAPQYETARDYDSVDLWQAEEESRFGQVVRQADIEFDANYCGPVINAVADGMVIDGIMATRDPDAVDDDDLPAEDKEATTLVNDIWDAQKLGQFYPSWQRKGLRDGDAYLMLWTVPGVDVSKSLPPEDLNITYMDPASSRLFYDEENPRVKVFFAWCWDQPALSAQGRAENGQRIHRLNIMYPDRIEKYGTEPRGRDAKPPRAEDFFPWVTGEHVDENGDDGSVILNPFEEVTVYHLRTDVTYGSPIHANAYAPQDAAAETIDRMLTTMAFQAWPQNYALQEAENMAQQTIREDPLAEDYDDGLDDFGDDLDRNVARDPASSSNETGGDLTSTPGGMMVLKGFKSVGQFQAANTMVFLEPWREFAKTVADTTGTPPWAFRAIGGEIPSGIALKIAMQPQTSRRSRCALLFGAEIADMLQMCAMACGMWDTTVTIQWAPFEPVDEVERWTLVKMRTDAGVPLEQALIMAGVPERQAREWAEQKKMDAEQEFQRQQALVTKKSAEDKPSADE
jgi:hypothetical protein